MNILDRIEQMEEPERAPSFLMQNKNGNVSYSDRLIFIFILNLKKLMTWQDVNTAENILNLKKA